MIKLIDLLEVEMQPSERAKMKNFLYRGTEDQIAQAASEFIMPPNRAIRPSDRSGVIEGGMLQTDHPENKRRGGSASWDEKNTLEEVQDIVRAALFGRELQVLEEVKKIIARLKQKGYPKEKILKFLMQYLNNLDEVGYVMKTKRAVTGGLTQNKEMFDTSVGNAE